MGLIDLKTDLKSLKYGNDQRGGGSSNQPYVTTPIPDGFAPTSPDFLLRNGYLNPVSSLNDVSRLTKWFADTKSASGILFTAKQQLLERQNVKIPGGFNRIYNPLGTIAQAGVLSTGYHLNKQGLNPFARGYFNGGDEGYYKTTLNDNEIDINRLYGLYKLKQIISSDNLPENSLLSSTYGISSNPVNIISYGGGPNSILGIGNTNIRFAGSGERERTNNETVTKDALGIINKGNIPTTTVIDSLELPFFAGGNIEVTIPNTLGIAEVIEQTPPAKNGGSTTLNALNNTYNPRISNKGIGVQGNFNREVTYEIGNTTYNLDRTDGPNTSYNSDKISLVPPINRLIQNDVSELTIDALTQSDIVKFYIEVINNNPAPSNVASEDLNVFLFFRAYLESINDNFKAEWQPYKYVGRGENFYKYNGFSRDFSLAFKVVATSRAEMIPIYQKLNYLASLTAPDYSKVGLMRGNFIRLTVGDYLDNVPCIIQSIGLKPIFDAGWDINRDIDGKIITGVELNSEGEITNQSYIDSNPYVGQLPRAIDVDLSIIPLHEFTPQLNQPYIGNDDHISEDLFPIQTPTQDGIPD